MSDFDEYSPFSAFLTRSETEGRKEMVEGLRHFLENISSSSEGH